MTLMQIEKNKQMKQNKKAEKQTTHVWTFAL